MRGRRQDDYKDALANFSLTFAKAMLVISFIMLLLISPTTKKSDGIKPKVDYIITMDWPNGDNDVDLWLRNSKGHIIYFGNKEADNVSLERDDMGSKNNSFMVNGKLIEFDRHQEIMSIRGIIPGDYTLTVNLFRSGSEKQIGARIDPIPVTVSFIQMNPDVKILYVKKLLIKFVRSEVFVTKFTLGDTLDDFVQFDDKYPDYLITYSDGFLNDRNKK